MLDNTKCFYSSSLGWQRNSYDHSYGITQLRVSLGSPSKLSILTYTGVYFLHFLAGYLKKSLISGLFWVAS